MGGIAALCRVTSSLPVWAFSGPSPALCVFFPCRTPFLQDFPSAVPKTYMEVMR